MRRKYLIIAFVGILIIVVMLILFKSEKATLDKGYEEEIKQKALELYQQKKAQGMEFSSQCLGTIYVNGIGYVVDIVHVPRSKEDNKIENQCQDYREGKVSHFIELDKNGEIVRII